MKFFSPLNKFFRKACFAFVLIFICVKSFSQQNNFPYKHFRRYSSEQGLSNKQVMRITQDKNGFIWFLTFTGLDRFDGMSVKSYHYDAGDKNSLMPGWFAYLVQDKKGVIWITDGNAGLYLFNPLTEKFKHFVNHSGDNNSLSSDWCSNIVEDSFGKIWIPTNSALDCLNPEDGNFKHFNHRDRDATSISNSYVQSICLDENNLMWMTTASPGVDCFNLSTGKIVRHLDFGS